MRNDLTDITVVLDRSGSMNTRKDDAEGGLNQFVKTQQEQPGQALFTLVQFDNVYEFVHRAVPIKDVPKLSLVPRGGTHLLDAVGRTIVETGERLQALSEADRPGLVVVLIITDGHENAQHPEYTKAKIKEMIGHQESVYKWKFEFLGADADAFDDAAAMGIGVWSAASYAQTSGGLGAAGAKIKRMRTMAASGDCVPQNFDYTDEERRTAASS